MINQLLGAVCIVMFTLSVTTQSAFADTAGDIKYRKSMMKSAERHMGAIVSILKYGTRSNQDLMIHTQALAQLAVVTGTLFPKGSGSGDTEASPAVWEKPDEFAKAVKQFGDATRDMNAAAMVGDMAMVGHALGELGKACKNCHNQFVKKGAARNMILDVEHKPGSLKY